VQKPERPVEDLDAGPADQVGLVLHRQAGPALVVSQAFSGLAVGRVAIEPGKPGIRVAASEVVMYDEEPLYDRAVVRHTS
jgi:hypothetical protein